MCNWFKKMFGGKNCCKNCCKKTDETAKPMDSTPMNMGSNQVAKPENGQSANVEKPL